MDLLLDTNILLWSRITPERLSATAQTLLTSQDNRLFFSIASLWEIAIKRSLNRPDFTVDPAFLLRDLQANDYQELGISSAHTLAVTAMPWLHRDPFDRILIAQANIEGLLLITADSTIARYPGPIKLI
jgi:PIN domain nuclease of toxin-antitoxin system